MAEKKVTLKVINQSGEDVSKVLVSAAVFGIEANNQVMFDSVQVYQANMRQGTAKVLTRAEVRGGGKKPWRQKGTGRARAGSSRSPIWRKGGIAFGPRGNQNYKLSQNKKEHALALKSALSLKAASKDIIVVDEFNFETISTKNGAAMLANIKAKAKTLIVINEENDNLVASVRNIPGVIVVGTNNLSVYDILNTNSVVFTKAAVKEVEGGLN
ncbi:MAG: 50S ribosomal protein L4 [Bacillales bacterium]|nr:50S ribosomal protein L4 [Bacillales bacterium]